MRLFVAIDLDDPARKAIAALQRRLRPRTEGGSRIRWVRPEQMHLTLVFLGEVDDDGAGRIVAAMGAPVALAPFDVAFGGIGVFPPRGAPRALWIGALEGGAAVEALQRETASRLVLLGIPPEQRLFTPHLTIGRWADSRPSDRRPVTADAEPGAIARVRVDHATLYRSRLSQSGADYAELARANLISA